MLDNPAFYYEAEYHSLPRVFYVISLLLGRNVRGAIAFELLFLHVNVRRDFFKNFGYITSGERRLNKNTFEDANVYYIYIYVLRNGKNTRNQSINNFQPFTMYFVMNS